MRINIIQKIIDIFRGKIKLQQYIPIYLDESFANPLYIKSKGIEPRLSELNTFILGSSHGLYGFVADGLEFNLCDASQDLYYSYKLYEKFQKLPKLKNLVLFYSVFSPGNELEKTDEVERCSYYEEFFKIPYKSVKRKNYIMYKIALGFYLAFRTPPIPGNYFGNNMSYTFMPSYANFAERVKGHLKNCFRKNNQTVFVEKMIALAKANNHSLTICIPPVREDYYKDLPSEEVMFEDLFKVVGANVGNVKLLNLLNGDDFDSEDFGDSDHLNEQGAKKLTEKIRGLL